MELKPIHIVDTLSVEPANHNALLRLLHDKGIPVMQAAGLELVSCRSTSPDLGEEVLIQVTWKSEDHAEFNQQRKRLVLDPDWRTYSEKLAKLRTGGTRRFFYPASQERMA